LAKIPDGRTWSALEELKQGIRRATIANKLIPVAGGSAFKNKGVQYLLDAVVDYLPSPLDIPSAIGMDPDNEEHQDRGGDFRQREVHRSRFQTLG
jgi:translation elongation factor EF-G